MAERDRRFGGNMERANTGIPYPTGGRDVRFQDSLPLQYQYRDKGRTVVSDTEPYYTDMGPNINFSPSHRQPGIGEANIRPQGIEQIPSGNYLQNYFKTIRDKMYGPEGPLTAAVPQDDWRTWEKILLSGGNPDDYEVETSDASNWINAVTGTGQSIYDTVQESPFGIDPFENSVGYDKQFDLPFGGSGSIGADYDLDDEEFNADLLAQWTWG